MKLLVRMFFKTLRIVIGPVILLWEAVTTPRGVVRGPEEQRRIDEESRGLVLYQFRTCPFCIKVRKEISRLSLKIELRDTQHDPQNRETLLQGGGRIQVPCLRITDGQGDSRWVYESADIIQYLHERFG